MTTNEERKKYVENTWSIVAALMMNISRAAAEEFVEDAARYRYLRDVVYLQWDDMKKFARKIDDKCDYTPQRFDELLDEEKRAYDEQHKPAEVPPTDSGEQVQENGGVSTSEGPQQQTTGVADEAADTATGAVVDVGARRG